MDSTPDLFETAPSLSDASFDLRALRGEDFDELHNAASDPLIWVGHPSPDRGEYAQFRKLFDTYLMAGGTELISERATGRVIGCSRFYEASSMPGACAIGFTFLIRDHWGGVTNRAIKSLMFAAAFEQFDTVYLEIAATNLRSQKAAAKIGAVFVKKVPGFLGGDVPYQLWGIERENGLNNWGIIIPYF